jgi:lipid II:glycine glycyltransferase (peptidoglycan interpeptide bridge formation enzyme)
MNLEFKKPQSDKQWDEYVLKLPNYSFLLSSARFQYDRSVSENAFRFLIFNNDQFVGIVKGFVDRIKIFGKYIECKHNPMLVEGLNDEEKIEILRAVFSKLKDIAQANNAFFVRASPLITGDEVFDKVYSEFLAKPSPIHPIDALISQYFDMSKSIEDLRHDMSNSTRNNINKLLRNENVSVKIVKDMSAFDIFKDFYQQTKEFKGFRGTTVKSLEKELKLQADNGMLYFLIGYYKEKPIAIWQNTKYGKYMHVYQAGSDIHFREKNIRITYLLFWESVKLCKELDVETLDLFGGMVPEKYEGKDNPWQGVNDFKMSFGGKKVTYMHPRDIPLKQFYTLYLPYAKFRVKLNGHTVNW